MLIFGFGPGKAEDLGEVVEATCPFCHNDVFLHHVRSKKAVRLYFVPVVPYGTDEYVVCPICTRGLQLNDDQRPLVGPMQTATAAYRNGRLDPKTYRVQAEEFWHGLGLRPANAPVEPGLPPECPEAPAALEEQGRSWVDQLTDLDRLREEGIVSDEQHTAAKKRIIEGE